MQELFASGQVIDLVIALMAIEVLVLWWWLGRRAVLPLSTLLAGLGLLLAWRFAHSGAPWPLVAAALMVAGGGHGVDVWRQWRSR
jgi:hypothetical protein